MTTLLDYVHHQFPNHDAAFVDDRSQEDAPLTTHTVVAHVVGEREAGEVLRLFRHVVDSEHVAAVVVQPVTPHLLPAEEEDRDGVVDIPNRRLAASAAAGAVAGAAIGLVGARAVSSNAAVVVIVAVFFAVLGGFIGGVWGGGARFASQRAVSQPHAPGVPLAVVAAFLDDEPTAEDLAHVVASREPHHDVRIVGTDGGWHSPGT